jgi:hypothetical protein
MKSGLNEAFDRDFWKQLSFFALVKPNDDVLPVRTVYDSGHNKRTQNIGLNYLRSDAPIWYAGPDLIASKILTGKASRILKAIQMIPGNPQKSLTSTNLGGMVEIRPAEEDFYRKVIEQRVSHKKTSKALADFLKVLANSGSYGLFVELNIERKKKKKRPSTISQEKNEGESVQIMLRNRELGTFRRSLLSSLPVAGCCWPCWKRVCKKEKVVIYFVTQIPFASWVLKKEVSLSVWVGR